VSLLHHPPVLRWASRIVRCRAEGTTDRFALTFDDGPSPTTTPRVLEILARHRARATFFVLSRHASRHAALLRRQRDAGHEVGVHGRWHAPPPVLPDAMLRAEVRHCATLVREATGEPPRWYRAPFGLMTRGNANAVRREGLEPVLGDVYPEDAARPGADRIVRRTLDRLRPGSVVILHDASVHGDQSRAQTLAALEAILEAAAARGLESVPLSELDWGDGA
jgi:peptidoglycan/xylan/chitin deacetylase (PgdA/CDA1 family)